MTKFIMKFLSFLRVVLSVSVLFCLTWVLMNVAILENSYFSKYENSYSYMEREHERQLIVGELINSQHAWEQQAEILQMAFASERAQKNKAELNFQLTGYETYHLLRRLELCFPEVYDIMMEGNKFPPELIEMFEFFDQMQNDTFDDGSKPTLAD